MLTSALLSNIDEKILHLLQTCEETEFPGIYKNRKKNLVLNANLPFLFVITGPTRSGKTTFLTHLESYYHRVITATSRSPRDNENISEYTWITEKPLPNEDISSYAHRIQKQYDLLEYNIFAGNVYGTPRKNIVESLQKGNSIISVENNGARALKQQCNSIANVIILFILPDSIQSLMNRFDSQRNNLDQRMQIAQQEIDDAPSIANYFVHNTELSIYCRHDESPIEFMKTNVLDFTRHLISSVK
ncbi:MAG: hypothetical protein KatS3mg084_0619 [Candidatus Dojkabacteria bacterium]|nr:MAG: hypothetical protein KatS3mg084_0619 [Candidatus Dojkabacteria bacterium]